MPSRVALRRCGASTNKPRCAGSHVLADLLGLTVVWWVAERITSAPHRPLERRDAES